MDESLAHGGYGDMARGHGPGTQHDADTDLSSDLWEVDDIQVPSKSAALSSTSGRWDGAAVEIKQQIKSGNQPVACGKAPGPPAVGKLGCLSTR